MRIWFERGFRAKPIGYELQKMFSPFAFVGYPGRSTDQMDNYSHDMKLLS
jgi:hypothetical protein